jgi:hypothetical protein
MAKARAQSPRPDKNRTTTICGAGRRLHEHDATFDGKRTSVLDPPTVAGQQRVDVLLLAAKPRHQRQIDITGLTRISPTLYRETAGDATPPVA